MRPTGGCAGCGAGYPASPREAAHPGLESGGPPDGLPGARSPEPGPAPLGGTRGAAGRPPGAGPKPAHAGEPAAGGRRGRPGGERSQPGGEAARVRAAARGLPASFPLPLPRRFALGGRWGPVGEGGPGVPRAPGRAGPRRERAKGTGEPPALRPRGACASPLASRPGGARPAAEPSYLGIRRSAENTRKTRIYHFSGAQETRVSGDLFRLNRA